MSDILGVVETSAGLDRLAWSLWSNAWLPVKGVSPFEESWKGVSGVDSWVRESGVWCCGEKCNPE